MKDFIFHPDQLLMYFRKSRQDNPDQTIEEVLAQHKRIADDWTSRNLSAPVPDQNIYMERVSGETIVDRVEFQKLLRRLESNSVEAVFVIEPQRLSRGDLEDCGHIINVFRYTNTKIITPHRVYDLSDDGDRMILEMELKSGNQYLEYTKRIMKRGKDDAARRGCWVPSCPPYGYNAVRIDKKTRTLQPNPDQAPVIRKIFEMYASGSGCESISHYLNENGIKPLKSEMWLKTTIRKILKNPVYIGKIVWNKSAITNVIVDGKQIKKKLKSEPEIYNGLHEAIIEEDLFQRVQDRFGNVPHTVHGKELKNVFYKILFCGKCGKPMLMYSNVRDRNRHVCKNQYYCHNGGLITDYLYEDVKKAIEKEISNVELTIQGDTTRYHDVWMQEVDMISSRIEKLNEKETKIWSDRYEAAEPMPEHVFRSLTAKLNDERNALRETYKNLLDNEPEDKNYEAIRTNLIEVLTCMNGDYSIEQKNKMMRSCIEKITVTRDYVKDSNNSYKNIPYEIHIKFKF